MVAIPISSYGTIDVVVEDFDDDNDVSSPTRLLTGY